MNPISEISELGRAGMQGRFIFHTGSTASDLNKRLKEARSDEVRARATRGASIAVLGNFSTQYLVKAIFASLAFGGVTPDIFEAPFDQWEFELNNPDSETSRRRSDYLLILLSSTRLIVEGGRDPEAFAGYLRRLISDYKSRSHGEVVLMLPESLREGFDHTSVFYRSVRALRAALLRELDGLVSFIDIDPLIMEFGFDRWHPAKFFYSAKLCCHPNCFPLFGNYIANFIQSLIARPTKLVIVDLDNTLWQGVVGDLGWESVGLDRDSTGYPHLLLQHYLLSLRSAGVLLAMCSKNDLDVVRPVFEQRSEMVLKWDHFSAREVNWSPKSENIRNILKTLNLSPTGVMFLDDAKFEREEVRRAIPEIIVPELPDNAEVWCELLSREGYLTVSRVSQQDEMRSRQYAEEEQRRNEASQHGDYRSFLEQLGLVIAPERVSPRNFDRSFELIQKTNQFNLTTRRLGRNELEQYAASDDCFCYCYGLKDKYSDYGIISVFIAEKGAAGWAINSWLMSCRAIGRGVEHAVFRHFVSTALKAGDQVSGKYLPTEKNQLVEKLLETTGFGEDTANGGACFVAGRHVSPDVEYIRVET